MDIFPELYWTQYFVSATWVSLVAVFSLCCVASGETKVKRYLGWFGCILGLSVMPIVFLFIGPVPCDNWLSFVFFIGFFTLGAGWFPAIFIGGNIADNTDLDSGY